MPATFISEPITPDASFDPLAMARGEPGLPERFRWRGREWIVAEVLETSKEYGDCKHGSGERYVRRHCFRLRTTNGHVLRIYFQRSFGRARASARWWLQSLEEPDAAASLDKPADETNRAA
jgi:hypothetical protein